MLIKLNCHVRILRNEGCSDASVSCLHSRCSLGNRLLLQCSWVKRHGLAEQLKVISLSERWPAEKGAKLDKPVLFTCCCFHFSCRLQPRFSPSRFLSSSSLHPKISPGTLGKHGLWHEGSNRGSVGTLCFFSSTSGCLRPDGRQEVRSNPLHNRRIADGTTNRIYLLKQCDRCSFPVTRHSWRQETGRERDAWLWMKAADWWQSTPSSESYAKCGIAYVALIHALEGSIENKWVTMTSNFLQRNPKVCVLRIPRSDFVSFVYKMWNALV